MSPSLVAELADVWRSRELIWFLAWRDVKVRYKQTALGVAWVLLQPVLSTLVFTACFSSWLTAEIKNTSYTLFALSGLVVWNFFSKSVSAAAGSLLGNAELVRRTYFPRAVIPLASVASNLPDFILSMAFLLSFRMTLLGGTGLSSLWLLPFAVIHLLTFTISVSLLLAALQVRYRDVGHAMGYLLSLVMFASPVVIPTEVLSKKWQWMVQLNPMTGILENFRAILFGSTVEPLTNLSSILLTVLILFIGARYFSHAEKRFADEI